LREGHLGETPQTLIQQLSIPFRLKLMMFGV
jgi:hypothetical protein